MNKVFILMILSLFISCEKEESSSEPDNYIFDRFDNYSDYKLYTKDGNINDGQVKATYISKYTNNLKQLENIPQPCEIHFTDSDTVTFITGTVKKKQIHTHTSGFDIFLSTDTTTVSSTIPDLDAFVEKLSTWGIFKPTFKKIYVTFDTGFSWHYKTIEANVAKKQNEELVLPMMKVVYLHHISWPQYTLTSLTNNKFDENFISTIAQGDTMLLQEYDIIYTKE